MVIETFRAPRLKVLENNQYSFIHRDISWLQFNERVLSEALEKATPILERIKFLSISYSNLDEFFTIRFSSLSNAIRKLEFQSKFESAAALRKTETFLLNAVEKFCDHQSKIFKKLSLELKNQGIEFISSTHFSSQGFIKGKEIFKSEVLPYLDEPREFTLKNLSELSNFQMAVVLRDGRWILVPKKLNHLYSSSIENKSEISFYFLDHLLFDYMGSAYGTPVLGIIRLTRNGDVDLDLEDCDPQLIPEIIRQGVRKRDQGLAVRLQYFGRLPKSWLENVRKHLGLRQDQIFESKASLCLQAGISLLSRVPKWIQARKHLSYPVLRSKILVPFRDFNTRSSKIFGMLEEKDYLFHHPYDSFDNFLKWIRVACEDPQVTQVELTVYRMDSLGSVIGPLKTVARSKKIRVLIEPRARFDELNNIRLADELRKAGAEVSFGFPKIKLHAKIALVTRKDGKALKHYTHLSTGNYNATTARQYTDLALLTANPIIGLDARHFFDQVFKNQLPRGLKKLVPSPNSLRKKILFHIQKEVEAAKKGKPARIVAKVNSLVDLDLIACLYRASCDGVQIDLLVRGACALIPGVKGMSENIRVMSVVDRFLEHSRIYYFKNSSVIYLSSADWMQRNFFSRLEIAFPILDEKIYNYLVEVLIPAYIHDTAKAWELTASGEWVRRRNKMGDNGENLLRSQIFFGEMSQSVPKGKVPFPTPWKKPTQTIA